MTQELSPRRAAFDRGVQEAFFGPLAWGAEHWLAVINTAAFLGFFLPVVAAPAFTALGWYAAADLIFAVTAPLCHHMPSRSFYLFGEQMAYCERNTALFGFFWLFGMAYIPVRRRLKSLPDLLAVVYCLPLAVDGLTQLFGWRESTWELRMATGAFFSLPAVWYVFPHFELLMPLTRRALRP